jgi:hypothetical protein
MKTLRFSALFMGLLIFAFSAVSAQDKPAAEKPWFDMVNCSFCKHLVKDTMLLKNMTWNHYDISNGLLAVTTVKPEYKAAYLEAMKAMEQVGQDMMSGKIQAQMCGHCENYGKLMMSGAHMEYIPAKEGDIVLMTSDKPEIVTQLKAFAQKNREELAKWEAEKK